MRTIEDLARDLGMEPPEEYYRRTSGGRTTHMLLDALLALEAGGEVRIVAHNVAYARRLTSELLVMAQEAEIERAAKLVRPPTSFALRQQNPERDRGGTWQDFNDHYQQRLA